MGAGPEATGKVRCGMLRNAADDGRGGSVLIVDGNAHNLDAMPSLMKRYWFRGWIVDMAADCIEAVQMLARRQYDLTVVNLYLPAHDLRTPTERATKALFYGVDVEEKLHRHGIAAVRAIANMQPSTCIIAWLGNGLPSYVDAARKAGAAVVVDCRENVDPLYAAVFERARCTTDAPRKAA
jgi:DNA-binding NarL/FixJ family response regulator